SIRMLFSGARPAAPGTLRSSPTRRSSDLRVDADNFAFHNAVARIHGNRLAELHVLGLSFGDAQFGHEFVRPRDACDIRADGELRSEEHTSELQSRENLVCRLLLEKKNWSM